MVKYLVILGICLNLLFGFDIQTQKLVVSGSDDKFCDVYADNLKIGQSGIVLHHYSNENYVIIAQVEVVQSSENKAKLAIHYDDIIKQDALPSMKRKVQNGDIVILNHLYTNILIIAPNFEAFKQSSKNFEKGNVLHPDILGAYLKITNKPNPTQKDFQDFSKLQNIGIYGFVFNKKLHIVDAISFKILETINLEYDQKETAEPFYTNIEDIKSMIYDFKSSKITNYDEYYAKIINKKEENVSSRTFEFFKFFSWN
jgi:hypothetical protein